MKCRLSVVAVAFLLPLAGCALLLTPPPSFVRTFDEPGTWKGIEVREGLLGMKDELWRIMVDSLAQKFDLEVLDKESCYVRTSWKYTLITGGWWPWSGERISERYRSRIVVKCAGADWRTVQVKSEASWLE